jgi:hypothetical protein
MLSKSSLPPAELLSPVVDGKEAAGGAATEALLVKKRAAKEALLARFSHAARGATLRAQRRHQSME